MITYKGHYEVVVTNVHGLEEGHKVRFVNKPSWFKRFCAKLAGFTWYDKEVQMEAPVRKTTTRKKTTPAV